MSKRQKAIDLVKLAADPRTPEHEALAAALSACKLIEREKLLEESGEGWSLPTERNDGWGELVVLSVTFLILTESSSMLRVAKITPPRLQSDKVLYIPKEYVKDVTMMTKAETKRIGWGSSRIIKQISLVKSYFESARAAGWDNYS